MMRWGLIPFIDHGEPPKRAWINARSETLSETFPWKRPWERQQRCILAAAGFYEPHLNEDGSKQPFYIHLVDRELLGMAGLWERSFKADGTEVLSCTIIMQPANRLLSEVHNEKKRMPSVLAREDHDAWLSGSSADAQAVLRPYPDDLMVAYPVSNRVNGTASECFAMPSNSAVRCGLQNTATPRVRPTTVGHARGDGRA
jgi:putative SOS response-associated peptidase YedK